MQVIKFIEELFKYLSYPIRFLWMKFYNWWGRRVATLLIIFIATLVLGVISLKFPIFENKNLLYGIFTFVVLFIKLLTDLNKSPVRAIKPIKKALEIGVRSPFVPGRLSEKAIRNAYKRRKEVDKIKEIFKKSRGVLLIGEPATGKTVIAKQFGLEMADKGNFVHYVNLTYKYGFSAGANPQNLVEKLEKELKNSNLKIYIIIEDIHHDLDRYTYILDKVPSSVKILLVGRTDVVKMTSPDRGKEVMDAYKNFYGFEKLNLNEVPVKEILEFARTEGGFSELNDEVIGQIESLSKGNLYILIFALQALEKKGEINSNEILETVEGYILDKKWEGKTRVKSVWEKLKKGEERYRGIPDGELKTCLSSIFKYLSYFSQYELPLESRLLFEIMEKVEGIKNLDTECAESLLQDLNKLGDIVKVEVKDSGNDSFWMIPHSRLANLISLALTKNPDDEVEAYWIYITTQKGRPPGKFPGTLLERLRWWNLLSKNINLKDFALNSNETTFKKIIKKLKESHKFKIRFEEFAISEIKKFVSEISKTNKILANEIINERREDNISKSLSKATIKEIGDFFDEIARLSNEIAEDMAIKFKKEILSKSFFESDSAGIKIFIGGIARVNEELAKKLVIDNRLRISQILSELSIIEITNFIIDIAKINKEVAKEIIIRCKEEICKYLSKSKTPMIRRVISEIAKVNSSDAVEIINQCREEIYTSLSKVDCSKIRDFILGMAYINEEVTKRLIIEEEQIICKCLFEVGTEISVNFIKEIARVRPDVGKEVIIQCKDGISKFLFRKDIESIGNFVSEIAEVNKEVAKEIIIQCKTTISKAFHDCSIEKVGNFIKKILEIFNDDAIKAIIHFKKEISEFFSDATIVEIMYIIREISKINHEIAKKFVYEFKDKILLIPLSGINAKDLINITYIMSEINSLEVAKEIINKHKDDILKISIFENDIKEIEDFFRKIARVNVELAIKYIITNGNEITKILTKLSINDIRGLISSMEMVNNQIAKEIVNLCIDSIAISLFKATGKEIIKFIQTVKRVNNEVAKEIVIRYEDVIARSIILKSSINEIQELISTITEIYNEFTKKIVNISQKVICSTTNVYVIGNCIFVLAKEYEEGSSHTIIPCRDVISKSISKASPKEIVDFILIIAKSNGKVFKEIINLNKEIICLPFKKATIIEINEIINEIKKHNKYVAMEMVDHCKDVIYLPLCNANIKVIKDFISTVAMDNKDVAVEVATRCKSVISGFFIKASIKELQDFISDLGKANKEIIKAMIMLYNKEICHPFSRGTLEEIEKIITIGEVGIDIVIHCKDVLSKLFIKADNVEISEFIDAIAKNYNRGNKCVEKILIYYKDVIARRIGRCSIEEAGDIIQKLLKIDPVITKEIVLKCKDEIISKSLHNTSIREFVSIIRMIMKIDLHIARKLINKHEKEIFRKSLTNVKIEKILDFLIIVSWANRRLGREIIVKNRNEISKSLPNVGCEKIRDVVFKLAKFDKEIAKEMLIQCKKAITICLHKISIEEIKGFIREIAQVNRGGLIEIIVNYKEEIYEALSKANPKAIRNFIKDISECFSKSTIWEFMNLVTAMAQIDKEIAKMIIFEWKEEISKIFYRENIEEIGDFLSQIAEVNEEFARSITVKYSSEIFYKSFSNASFWQIRDFVIGIARGDREIARQLVSKRRNEIYKSLNKVYIRGIGDFIKRIAEFDEIFAKEIVFNFYGIIKSKINSSWREFVNFTFPIARFNPVFTFCLLKEYFNGEVEKIIRKTDGSMIIQEIRELESDELLSDFEITNLRRFHYALLCLYKDFIIKKFEMFPDRIRAVIETYNCEEFLKK